MSYATSGMFRQDGERFSTNWYRRSKIRWNFNEMPLSSQFCQEARMEGRLYISADERKSFLTSARLSCLEDPGSRTSSSSWGRKATGVCGGFPTSEHVCLVQSSSGSFLPSCRAGSQDCERSDAGGGDGKGRSSYLAGSYLALCERGGESGAFLAK